LKHHLPVIVWGLKARARQIQQIVALMPSVCPLNFTWVSCTPLRIANYVHDTAAANAYSWAINDAKKNVIVAIFFGVAAVSITWVFNIEFSKTRTHRISCCVIVNLVEEE
jgi:hypothetical protein